MRAAGAYSAPARPVVERSVVEPVATAAPMVEAVETAVATRTRRPARLSRTRDAVRAAVAKDRTDLKRRISSAGVMTVVFGIFASVTLPAFADQGSEQQLAANMNALGEQNLTVQTDDVQAATFSRDTYSASSAAELRALYADAVRQQAIQVYMTSGAREMGDDYPWFAEPTRGQGGGLSPLNYYYRECVDFVAWRLNRDAGTTSAPYRWVWSNLTPSGGSAYAWKRAWEAKGWPTGDVPQVGAVAWVPGGNHVAYVSGVLADGSVVIEEYNGMVDHGYSQRVIPPTGAYYLYAPPR